MRRSTWFAVLITTVVLAIASIIPWMLRAPTVLQAPVSTVLPGTTANAANDWSALSTTPPAVERVAVHAATSLPAEDQELIRVAVRGGLMGVGAAALTIVIGWRIAARGGVRRRAITLAGRGLRTADVARRTRLSQDAVRTLLVPDVALRRRKSVA